jgi:hypothetical protein
MPYQHNNRDPNLNNLHHAMELVDEIPHVRVTLGSDNITITGDVNLVDTVTVNSTPEDPVHTHITEVGTSGILAVPYMPIQGTVNQGTAGATAWKVNIGTDGTVTLAAGSASIGTVGLNAGTNSIGTVGLNAGTNTIGKVDQASTSNPWVISKNSTVNSSSNPLDVTFTNTSIGTTFTNTSIGVTQGTTPWQISKDGSANSTSNRIFVDVGTPTVTVDQPVAVTDNNTTLSIDDGGGVITVDGTVELGTTTLAALETITVNQGTNPWTVNGNVNATITGTGTVTLGTGSTDAFGRLRVSEPYTLFDTKSRYYDHNDFSSSTSTGGTVVYDANGSTFQLNVTAANGSSVIRETKRVFPYQPGKSLLVMNTFCMNTPKTNLRQRVGYFTTNNGIYFENDGVYNYLVIRSYSSGALVEDRVRQDAWDNPFAGLNVDRTQIFWTDIEWLGVGSVRCGFVINGAYVLCHTFHHANVAGNTTTYMTTAVLPVRYEITNTAGTSGASMMRQICATVISEGGYNAFTYSETAGRGTSVLRLVNAGTYYPLVSIRLDSTRLDAIVLPRQVDVLSPTVNYYRWKLMLNPTLTDATWAGTSTSGTVEYDTAATAISGGIELQAGYVSSRELSELGADAFAFQLGRTLAGVSDIVTLAMAATSNNADVLAQIGWQEIT